jgi:hypothetical protein
MEEQKYCISARSRRTGVTMMAKGPMSKEDAEAFIPKPLEKKHFVYFRVAKYPFKEHKK